MKYKLVQVYEAHKKLIFKSNARCKTIAINKLENSKTPVLSKKKAIINDPTEEKM